mgnify:FL=1
MSITLKRPMFRRGGEVGGGITSGMRENFEVGTKPSERIRAVLDEYSAPAIDPINQLLIEGGLRGMSTAGKGGTLANLASAFEEPTQNLFKNLAIKRKQDRDTALEGVIADIGQEQSDEANRIKKEIAELQNERIAAEGDKDRQNKIDVEILKNKNELEQIEKKAELKVGKEFRTDQVRPAFENVVNNLTTVYAESKNPAVKASPDLSAFNVTKFRREASPDILAKYRGFKPYTFDNKGKIIALPTDNYKPGDIIYDPLTTDFLVFDNTGGTYRLDPLTFEIQE